MAKKNYIPVLVGGSILAAGIYLYKTGKMQSFFSQLQQKTVSELKLRLTGFHATTDGEVMADIEVINPSSVGMQVQSIVGDVMVNNARVGTIKMFGDTILRPNDQTTLPLSVKINPAAAGLLRKKGAKVAFNGTININNHVAPLTMAYSI